MLIRKVVIWQLLFRYTLGMTWKIVAWAETFGLRYGVGYMLTFWFEQFNMIQVMAWIALFVALMLDFRTCGNCAFRKKNSSPGGRIRWSDTAILQRYRLTIAIRIST